MNWNQLYRPSQVKGLHLTKVRDYFKNVMKSETFPQVFLFTGPKGTGKTSTARILGALLNDPRNEKSVQSLLFDRKKPSQALKEPNIDDSKIQSILRGQSYLVQELDAASNRGIDDVRALKESIYTPPAGGLVSVYILDEVHMLTTEAFNALLKILEEPPSHVIFILATTELHKIPATVASRCQLVSFSRASNEELTAALENIITQEEISVSPDMVEKIVSQADGSFRDCIKLLQMTVTQNISTLDELTDLLGDTSQSLVPNLVQQILEKDPAKVVAIFSQLRLESRNEISFHRALLVYLHNELLASYQNTSSETTIPTAAAQYLLLNLSSSELSQASPIPFLRLELAILEVVQRAQQKNTPSTQKPSSSSTTNNQNTSVPSKKLAAAPEIELSRKTSPETNKNDSSDSLIAKDLAPANIELEEPKNVLTTSDKIADNRQICQEWAEFVRKISEKNFGLGTLLKSAQPSPGNPGELILAVYYTFHQEQLCQPKFRQLLDDEIVAEYGGSLSIQCQIVEQPVVSELLEPNAPALEKLAAEALM